MSLYFARHGQTVFGLEKRLEGASNSALTSKGKEQAKRLGSFLLDKNISRLMSSPLGRAKETAEIVSQIIEIRPKIDETWSEMCYGQWEGKLKTELSEEKLWPEREKNKFSFIHPGSFGGVEGESYEILGKRLEKTFLEVKRNFPKENAVIISHLGILRSVRRFFENISENETVNFSPHNNHVIKLDYCGGKIEAELIEIQKNYEKI